MLSNPIFLTISLLLFCISQIMNSMSAVLSAKKCRKITDRISTLPQNVTQQILERLPLQEAARTSILSSHWKHEWASISQLVLDEQFSTSITDSSLSTADRYCKVVDDILLSHVGPIHKLVLYLPSWFIFPAETDISRWIRYARANGVKDFTLEAAEVLKWSLPSYIFSCVGLTNLSHLTLIKCKLLSLPPTFGGFPYLVSLKVEAFKRSTESCIDTSVLENLISKCPQLRSLDVALFQFTHLTVRAPKLKDLFVKGVIVMISLCLEGATSLNTLALDMALPVYTHRTHISKLLSHVTNVEKLVLGTSFWLAFETSKLTLKMPKILQRLHTLELVGIQLYCQLSSSFVFSLFSSSPLLEQLYIEDSEHNEVPEDGVPIQIDGSYKLQCLRNIQLVHVSGMKSELQLIKYLLAYSSVLEKMTVKLSAGMEGAEERFEFAKETSRYCRASPNAELIINALKVVIRYNLFWIALRKLYPLDKFATAMVFI